MRRLLLLAAALVALTACRAPAPEHELVVFAAASLREAFGAIAGDFERARPTVRVTFNFAGSQELRTQIEQGADADVFASADQKHMDALARLGRTRAPALFARNEPVVVVARERAASIRSFADLPNASRIVVGAPEVPIGRYTGRILDNAAARLGVDFRARIEAKVASRELNVRQVLAKVSLGEADAGFVYRSDVAAAGDRVATVSIPHEINVVAEYPIAVVADAPHPELARAWVDEVLSPPGQRALAKAGFLAPARVGQHP
jgi:molybdate transport system substrate-binding protein